MGCMSECVLVCFPLQGGRVGADAHLIRGQEGRLRGERRGQSLGQSLGQPQAQISATRWLSGDPHTVWDSPDGPNGTVGPAGAGTVSTARPRLHNSAHAFTLRPAPDSSCPSACWVIPARKPCIRRCKGGFRRVFALKKKGKCVHFVWI